MGRILSRQLLDPDIRGNLWVLRGLEAIYRRCDTPEAVWGRMGEVARASEVGGGSWSMVDQSPNSFTFGKA